MFVDVSSTFTTIPQFQKYLYTYINHRHSHLFTGHIIRSLTSKSCVFTSHRVGEMKKEKKNIFSPKVKRNYAVGNMKIS